MKNQDRLEMIEAYIKNHYVPILLENIQSDIFDRNSVILPADININELTGHYEEKEFLPPSWYQELKQYENENYCFLVIKDLSSISKEEQLKFGELLKYRKVNVFNLPKNCVIIIAGKSNQETMNDTIYSLVAVM